MFFDHLFGILEMEIHESKINQVIYIIDFHVPLFNENFPYFNVKTFIFQNFWLSYWLSPKTYQNIILRNKLFVVTSYQ